MRKKKIPKSILESDDFINPLTSNDPRAIDMVEQIKQAMVENYF